MGDIKKKRSLYSRPKKLYDLKRIEDEGKIIKKYGLKNNKEVWKAKSAISTIRRRAKALISKSEEEKQRLYNKLNKAGYKVTAIADVLALTEEDLLNRRLQTFVSKKGLANSPKQARQLIVHKQIMVNGNTVNIPSYNIRTDEEDKITMKEQRVKPIKVEKTGELVVEEVKE